LRIALLLTSRQWSCAFEHGEVQQRRFYQRELKATKAAVTLQSKLGHPSTADMRWILKHNMIKDCPVSTQDVDNALAIYGPSVPALKGKTAKKKVAVVTRDLVKVSREFMKLVKDVTLCVDIFFRKQDPMHHHIEFEDLFHHGRSLGQLQDCHHFEGHQVDLCILPPVRIPSGGTPHGW
jgi:hypothetical protein